MTTYPVDVERRRAVILVVGLDAVNERQVVHVLGQMRKAVRKPAAALAVLGKFKRAADGDVWKGEAALQFAGDLGDARERFAMKLAQLGLVLERVHLADSTLHEEKNAVLGLARKVR